MRLTKEQIEIRRNDPNWTDVPDQQDFIDTIDALESKRAEAVAAAEEAAWQLGQRFGSGERNLETANACNALARAVAAAVLAESEWWDTNHGAQHDGQWKIRARKRLAVNRAAAPAGTQERADRAEVKK
jgi:hypothetical protein